MVSLCSLPSLAYSYSLVRAIVPFVAVAVAVQLWSLTSGNGMACRPAIPVSVFPSPPRTRRQHTKILARPPGTLPRGPQPLCCPGLPAASATDRLETTTPQMARSRRLGPPRRPHTDTTSLKTLSASRITHILMSPLHPPLLPFHQAGRGSVRRAKTAHSPSQHSTPATCARLRAPTRTATTASRSTAACCRVRRCRRRHCTARRSA